MIEEELKLRLSRDAFYHLLGCFHVEKTRELLNVYYDTEQMHFFRGGHTLRLRYEKGTLVYPTLQLKARREANNGRFVCREKAVRVDDCGVPAYLQQWTPAEQIRFRGWGTYKPLFGSSYAALQSEVAAVLPKDEKRGLWGLTVNRVGSIRTTRHVLTSYIGDIELDHVKLPHGKSYFELEYEAPERRKLDIARMLSLIEEDLDVVARRTDGQLTFDANQSSVVPPRVSKSSKYQMLIDPDEYYVR